MTNTVLFKRMIKSLLFITLLCACIGASVAAPLEWEFRNDGDYLGWTAEGFVRDEVTGGSIKAITRQFSFLHSPVLSIDASRYTAVEFIAKSNRTGAGSIYFKHPNEALADSRSAAVQIIGDGRFHKYTVNMSANPEWKGTIEQIRLDVIYAANTQIEVSYIAFLDSSKTSIDSQNMLTNGSFDDYYPDIIEGWSATKASGGTFKLVNAENRGKAAQLQGNVTIYQFVVFDKPGYYQISLDTRPISISKDDRLSVMIVYSDILGRKIDSDVLWNVPVRQLDKWINARNSIRIPDLAATAVLNISLESKTGGASVQVDNVVCKPDTDANEQSAILQTGKAFAWSADWIWIANAADKDKTPVFFRKTFDLDNAKLADARLIITADNEYSLYINGHSIGRLANYKNWRKPDIVNIKPYLKAGRNVIAIKAINSDGPAGLIFEAGIHYAAGKSLFMRSNAAVKCSKTASGNWTSAAFNDSDWQSAKSLAKPPAGAWGGNLPYVYLGHTYKLAVSNLKSRKTITAGEKLPFSFVLENTNKYPRNTMLYVDLVKKGAASGTPLYSRELSGKDKGKISVSGNYRLSGFQVPGDYYLKVSVTNSHLSVKTSPRALALDHSACLPVKINQNAKQPKSPVVQFKLVNGSPQFVINGKPRTSFNYWAEDTSVKDLIPNCRDNGIHIYWLNVVTTPLLKSGKFDFAKMDEVCTSLLTQDPDGYIVLIVPIDGVYNLGLREWSEKDKAELTRDSDGSTEIPDYGGNPGHSQSMASKKWLAMAENLMRQLVRHARGSKYSDRIIGYLPSSGMTYEWQQWGSTYYPPVFVDYCEPARLAFVDWLKNKYKNLDELNSSWKTSISDFNRIQIPTREERMKTDYMTFLDPQKSMREIDFRQYYSELVADVILHITKTVKEETKGQTPVGVFYGYVTHVLAPYRYQLIGHSALHKVLTSPDIDFLMSPSDYGDRQAGGGSGLMGPVSSVLLNNKMWVDQADLRTHHSILLERVKNLKESKAAMIRNYANALINQCSEQVYDFSLGWSSGDKRLMQLAGKLNEIDKVVAKIDRSNEDKSNSIAVIIDEKSTYYTGMSSNIHSDLVNYQYRELSRTGVGFDMYLLDDIDKIPDHKVYLFLNTFRISLEQQKVIDSRLKRSGKTLVFVYAPGIVDERLLLPQRISDITGINIQAVEKEMPVRVQISMSGDPILKYVSDSTNYGSVAPCAPVFVAAEGTILGLLQNLENRPGLVVKRFNDWTSVYSSAPALPAGLLRGIAEDAGVLIGNPQDEDITYASGRLLAVHTLSGGDRTLHFAPKTGKVVELTSGRSYELKNGAINCKLEPVSSSIFLAP